MCGWKAMRLGLCLTMAAGWCSSSVAADDGPAQKPAVPAGKPAGAVVVNRAPEVISANDIKPRVYFLASPEMRGRGDFGSRAKAAQYIVNEFHKASPELKPLFDKQYHQDVPGPRANDGSERIIGRNLGVVLEGRDPKLKDEYVILSAHYDHLGEQGGQIFAGADDNAAAVAMMIEVAKHIARSPQRPKRSIMFVSFDLEESMLWGSKWFVAHPPRPRKQIKLFMTADLLGRSLGDLPFRRLFVMGAERGTGLKSFVRSVTPTKRLGVTQLGADLIGTLSDYGPFRDDSIPFLFFSTGRHPDYHSPRDTPDRIDYQQVADISNLILGLTRQAAEGDQTPNWIESPTSDMEEVAALRDLTKVVLDEDERRQANGGRALQPFHRQLVTTIFQYADRVVRSGQFPETERAWLRRSTQFLLATVF
jgi:hypothetical protein